jgi:hypothetical protein
MLRFPSPFPDIDSFAATMQSLISPLVCGIYIVFLTYRIFYSVNKVNAEMNILDVEQQDQDSVDSRRRQNIVLQRNCVENLGCIYTIFSLRCYRWLSLLIESTVERP